MERNTKLLLISVLVSLIAIAIILSGTISKDTFYYLSTMDPLWLLVALALHVVYWTVWALRIKVLVRSLGKRISFLRSMKVVLVNVLAASVTPSNAGGEPVRIKMLNDYGLSGGDATAVVVGERVSDAIFLLSMLPILIIYFGFSLSGLIGDLLIGAFVLLSLSLIFIAIIVWKHKSVEKIITKFDFILRPFVKSKVKRFQLIEKIKEEFLNFKDGMKILVMRNKFYFILVIMLSAILWLSDFVVFSIILLSFHQNPIWIYSFLAQIIIVLLTIIPISPGGSGLVEFASAILYSPFIKKDVIGIVILMWRFVVFYLNIIVGSFFTFSHIFSKKK